MVRSLSITFFFTVFCFDNYAQPLSAQETVKNYSVAQKRLLVVSTAQFFNFIAQNNLDQDSILTFACRITGMPFLLPFNEGFANKISTGSDRINAASISKAILQLKSLEGEERVQLLIELGIWYLHKPGSYKPDLDSANLYIETASNLITAGNYTKWKTECRFLIGELLYQTGNISESKNVFAQIILSGRQERNIETTARAYQQFGAHLPAGDSMRLTYFQKSFELYQQLHLQEKEIELLWDIAAYHRHVDINLMEKDFRKILSLQQSSGFKHTLYTQNIFSFVRLNQAVGLDALDYANAALENMKWSGISEVRALFFIRVGAAYEGLGKNEEALAWFRKALETGQKDNHLLWYKSLFFAAELLFETNRAEESLEMIDSVTRIFPAMTLWEKMQTFSLKGVCYRKLNNYQLADKYFMDLLYLANENPGADPNGELINTYLEIANFYATEGQIKKSHLFLEKANEHVNGDVYSITKKYSLMFKIDSAERNFESAMQNHIQYKFYSDSLAGLDQRKKLDEVTIKYAAEKKDQDIKLLKQQGVVQQTELTQNKLTRNIMIAGTGLLLVIVALLFSQYKLKQRANREVNKKNTALLQLVDEKEWLLKEVHHRVKNNLQIIISLLNTQSNYLESDEAITAIKESQARMHAISLIHQKLYKSEDTAFINVREYVDELVEHIKNGLSKSSGIIFDLDVSNDLLDVAQAVPLGLILNEAISNAVKYAFPENLQGMVQISLRHSSDESYYVLHVTDNGVGLPVDYDISKAASLGISLMKGLSKQLGGSFKIESNSGVHIEIVFKDSQVAKIIRNQTIEI